MTEQQKIDNLSATLSVAEQELRAIEPKRLNYGGQDAWVDALVAHQWRLHTLKGLIENVSMLQDGSGK